MMMLDLIIWNMNYYHQATVKQDIITITIMITASIPLDY